ncbi:hypothetical protein GQ457_14G013300 [Hibiscus cannabinus]
MRQLVEEFQDVFLTPTGLPPEREHDHAIHLEPSSKPVNVKSYRYPYFQKQEVERQIQQLLEQRALNAITIKDKFPIPTAEELFDELGSSQYFSKLDLLSGYHQIRVKMANVPKTAFRTYEGHYEFLVMPFGLTNAPLTFQAIMNDVFKPYLRKFVLVFLDDILIYSATWQDHLEHEGLAVDFCKVEAIKAWPIPTSIKGVRGFLGIAGYYRKFIKGFSTLAASLSDLLRKGEGFDWTAAAQEAFDQLKQRLCSAPVLGLPDFSKEFIVETDASGVGIGAVLHQGDKLLAFYSQKLSPRMQGASTYHQEMFAITQAVGKWIQYLLGRKFIIITDQRSLRELTQQVIQTPEQQRWLSKLIGYEFEIRYRPGKLNEVSDALSREMEYSCMALSRPLFGVLEDLRAATKNDLDLQQLCLSIKGGTHDNLNFTEQEGLVLFHGKIVVPNEAALKSLLLREFHCSKIGGHAGINRTYQRISANFHWIHLGKDVREFVKNCQTCQRMKSESLVPAGLLQPLPIPCQVLKTSLWISLWVYQSRMEVAKVLIQGVVKLHGIPKSLVSGRDRMFISELWTEMA